MSRSALDAPASSRRELERLTAQLAELNGWRHHHLRVADRLKGGYPYGFATEVLVRAERAVFVFYTWRDRPPTPAQREWTTALESVELVEPLIVAADQAPRLVKALASEERAA